MNQVIKRFCCWGWALFLVPVLAQADDAQADSDSIAPGIAAPAFRAVLERNFTPYLGKLLADPAARRDFVQQYYAFQGLEQRAEQQLSAAEKERIMVELELRRSEILRDAVIKHALDARNPDIEALARERYQVGKDSYKTRRRIKIAQIFIARKPGQDEAIRQQMAGILKQLEEDNLRYYQAAEARRKSAENEKATGTGAESARAEAETGGDEKETEKDLFAELAKQYSEDVNAQLGGFDSRWLLQPTREIKDPVANAAFELLQRGEITGVIEGPHGYHILRLMDYVPNRQQTFDEVRNDIMATIKEQLWAEQGRELTEALQAPRNLAINDELAQQVIAEVYKARDPALKQLEQPSAPAAEADDGDLPAAPGAAMPAGQ